MDQLKIFACDPQDPRVTNLRKKILREDMQTDWEMLAQCQSRKELLARWSDHPEKEDIYKFSDLKWGKTQFDAVEVAELNGEIVSISGRKVYADRYMRLGMHYYTLKKFRNVARSLLWKKEGFVDSALRSNPVDHCFITIYPHNRKLRIWSQKLMRGKGLGQLGTVGLNLSQEIRRFQAIGTKKFNNVPQLFLHFSPKQVPLPENFFAEIGATE